MSVEKAAELMRQAKNAVALTGAGISTPSGIPDFRSEEGGLWTRYDPMEVASLFAFRHNPERFFEWIRPLIADILEAQPNPAHLALARLEAAGFLEAVITQNIDNLHQRAGSKTVYEVHGTFYALTCTNCYRQYKVDEFLAGFLQDGSIPRCTDCDSILKPDAILFGEQLPYRTWQRAEKAARECDLMLVAGSSLEVTPVAGLPWQAVSSGASLIVVNHTPTYIDERAEVVLNQDVAEVLPLIADETIGERTHP